MPREEFEKEQLMFQFPSNGKVDPNTNAGVWLELPEVVSIPFKRESGS